MGIPARPLDLGRAIRLSAAWAVLFVLLLGAALAWFGFGEAMAQLGRLSPGVVLLALGLSLVNYVLRAIRWQVLCRAMGVRIPMLRNSLYYVAGFAFTVTPGKVGEVVRLWLLRRDSGAAYERSLGLLVIDRVTDAVPLLVLCLLGMGRFVGQAWSVAVAAAAVLACLGLILRPEALMMLVKAVYARLRRAPRLFARALRLLRTVRLLAAPRVLLKAFGLGALGWSSEVVAAWVVLQAFDVPADLAAAAFVFAFGMLVGALPLFPGGVGGAEGAMVMLLLLLGEGAGTAVAAVAVIRLCTLGFAVVLGFLALPFCLHRSGTGHPSATALGPTGA
jgi:uncharacterized protein (TIRG00374 family)